MSLNTLPTIQDVVDKHLCSGCGACSYAFPKQVQMVDTVDHARRPKCVSEGSSLSRCVANTICPSAANTSDFSEQSEGFSQHAPADENWGNVIEVWEGYASDKDVRFRGSSGGVVTALAIFGLEQKQLHGVLHVRGKQSAPLINETVLSRSRNDVLSGAGSRYSPASPCEELSQIEEADGPCMFIGKPCDVAGATSARQLSSRLNKNLAITVAIFCAGTPSIKGTLALAKHLGVDDPNQITKVKYRGEGWPGLMEVEYKQAGSNGRGKKSVTYADGWGKILQKHRQWRCNMCADHTGESADISVGDPWYRPVDKNDPGRSLILVRTERGRRLIREAMSAGAIVAEPRDRSVVSQAQHHLLKAQASIWGRNLASRSLGLSTPKLFATKRRWRVWLRELTGKEKIQSVLGCAKRIFSRKLLRPEAAEPFQMPSKP